MILDGLVLNMLSLVCVMMFTWTALILNAHQKSSTMNFRRPEQHADDSHCEAEAVRVAGANYIQVLQINECYKVRK